MPLTTILLEYTSDPVSDTTPTWTTVANGEFKYAEWWAGIDEEGDDPQPGGAVIVLINKDRKWEPFFASNTIDTHQRFRLSLNGTQEGVWFITKMDIDYPGNSEWSEITFTCGDGMEILALNNMPSLDPPDAETYEDVVDFDNPSGFWMLNDPSGTVATAKTKKVWVGRGRNRRRVTRRRPGPLRVASEAVGVVGSAGVYRNASQLILGRPGAIVGSAATAVYFTSSGATFGNVRVPLSGTEIGNATQALTVEALVKIDTTAPQVFVTGPSTAASDPIWIFAYETGSGGLELWVHDTAGGYIEYFTGGSPLTADVWSHVMVTYDHREAHIFVDGVEVAGSWGAAAPLLDPPAANTFLYIGADPDGGTGSAGVDLQAVAVYDHALPGERCHAHMTAALERGNPQEEAAERISDLAADGPWSVTIDGGIGMDVQPVMHHGQPRLDEISETMRAEGHRPMFFFTGQGGARYLGWEWQSTAAVYNTVQATFGEAVFGELPVELDRPPGYDHETFNVVEASREGGRLVEVEDTVASGKRGRRVLPDYQGLLLAEQHDVETIAADLLFVYKDPVRVVKQIGVTGWDDARLTKILALDIGHMVKVNWSGDTGARNSQVANIISKHKTLSPHDRVLRCSYRLTRGFDASDAVWRLGIPGYTELNTTTILG